MNSKKKYRLHLLWLILPLLAVCLPLLIYFTTQSYIAYRSAYLIGVQKPDDGSSKLTLKDSSVAKTNSSSSVKDLIYGNTGINGGNYILFIAAAGSTVSPINRDEIAGTDPIRDYPSLGFNRSLFSFFDKNFINKNPTLQTEYERDKYSLSNLKAQEENSAFVEGLKDSHYYRNTATTDEEDRLSLGFYTYFIDYQKGSYGNTRTYNGVDYKAKETYYSPLYKWTDYDHSHKIFSYDQNNKANTKWDKAHTVNDYAINNSVSKDFRSTIADLSTFFTDTSFYDQTSIESKIWAMAWVNGEPKTAVGLSLTNPNEKSYTALKSSWTSFIDSNYNGVEKP